MNSKELTEEDAEKIGDIDVPVSTENEEKVWAFLETRTALLMRAYETTEEVHCYRFVEEIHTFRLLTELSHL